MLHADTCLVSSLQILGGKEVSHVLV